MMTVDLAKEKHGIRERFAKVFFFAKNGRFQIKTFRLSIINHIHIYIYSRVSKALAFFHFFPYSLLHDDQGRIERHWISKTSYRHLAHFLHYWPMQHASKLPSNAILLEPEWVIKPNSVPKLKLVNKAPAGPWSGELCVLVSDLSKKKTCAKAKAFPVSASMQEDRFGIDFSNFIESLPPTACLPPQNVIAFLKTLLLGGEWISRRGSCSSATGADRFNC